MENQTKNTLMSFLSLWLDVGTVSIGQNQGENKSYSMSRGTSWKPGPGCRGNWLLEIGDIIINPFFVKPKMCVCDKNPYLVETIDFQ